MTHEPTDESGVPPRGIQGPSGATGGLAWDARKWMGRVDLIGQAAMLPWLERLYRNCRAAADTGHELPEETLKAARDFLGVLVGR